MHRQLLDDLEVSSRRSIQRVRAERGTSVAQSFQQSTSISDIYKAAAASNPVLRAKLAEIEEHKRKSPQFAAAATQALRPTQVGLTVFPPNNAVPTIVSPPPSMQLKNMMAATAGQLPDYFNWADLENVRETKGWGRKDPYVMPVQNQLLCGSCWAVSSSSVFSDRWAIWTQGPNPQLSATDVLACVAMRDGSVSRPLANFANTNGCNGGMPAAAAVLFAEYGITKKQCLDYSWCEQAYACTRGGAGGDELNALIPQCGSRTCPADFKGKPYRQDNSPPSAPMATSYQAALAATTQTKTGAFGDVYVTPQSFSTAISLTDVRSIKEEIYNNGPVVGAYAVFGDFQGGTAAVVAEGLCGPGERTCELYEQALEEKDWAPTKGVYCNVQSRSGPYAGTVLYSDARTLGGYHAIAVIGWGIEKDVWDWTAGGTWKNPVKTFDLPYWICRNSWSEAWNANNTIVDPATKRAIKLPGYFKIAMTDVARGINTEVKLDSEAQLGGCTAFMPNVVRAAPPAKPVKPAPVEKGKKGKKGKSRLAIAGYLFDGNLCKPTEIPSEVQYNTLDGCLAAHPDAVVTYDTHWQSFPPNCVVNKVNTGKYKSLEECQEQSEKEHNVNYGLIFGAVGLVIAGLIIFSGIYFSKRRA